MDTQIVAFQHLDLKRKIPGLSNQLIMRETPLANWLTTSSLADRLSGTLRKNARLGFKYQSQLKEEALAQTLGWAFESVKSTYVTFNDAISEGDSPSLTEVGWFVDRLLAIHPWEDEFLLKYIVVQDSHGVIERQGVGVIVKSTSIQWIPKGDLVFALLTEYDVSTKTFSECINPF